MNYCKSSPGKFCVSINFPGGVAGRPKHETCRNKVGGGGVIYTHFCVTVWSSEIQVRADFGPVPQPM